ncbi:hypothetical protein SLE2022_187670 [Rubroshorea leprosula]
MENMQNPKAKWEGKVCTRLTRATADQIWPLFKDFFNLHKWFPGLATCHGIHGANGEPGCIRYCAGFSISSATAAAADDTRWSKEKLISVDESGRSLSYEMVDSNIGFKSYVSMIKVNPGDGDQDGCVIEWRITVDPVEGWTLDDFVRKYEVGLQTMAKTMEDALLL